MSNQQPNAPAVDEFDWLAKEWQTVRERGWSLKDRPPARDYLLRAAVDSRSPGLVPAGRVGMLFAAGGSGKTLSLAALAVAVASGAPWLGAFRVERPGDVLLALAEEDAAEVLRRMYNAAKVMKLDDEAIDRVERRIVPLPLIGHDVTCTTGIMSANGIRVHTPFFDALRGRLRSREWSAVIVDPISRFGGPDVERDNSAATFFIEALEQITKLPSRPNVFIAHHQGKAKLDELKTARGASALRDGVRWEASLEGRAELVNAPRLVDFKITKSNYGTYPPPVILSRDPYHEGALRVATPAEIKAYADATKKPSPKADGPEATHREPSQDV